MSTYSFLNVLAVLTGPGGVINLGAGAAPADEGITVEYEEDQNVQTTGADGNVMNSLRATRRGHAVVRLLKTSPVNNALSLLFNFQKQSSANWGTNVIAVTDIVRGDFFSCKKVAFAKHAPATWAKDGNTNEWRFHCGQIDPLFGLGVPDINV